MTVYECLNAGGVMLGWGRDAEVVAAQAEITARDYDVETRLQEAEYDADRHGASEEIVRAF